MGTIVQAAHSYLISVGVGRGRHKEQKIKGFAHLFPYNSTTLANFELLSWVPRLKVSCGFQSCRHYDISVLALSAKLPFVREQKTHDPFYPGILSILSLIAECCPIIRIERRVVI